MSVWIMAARPTTLPAAIAPVIIGTVMAYGDGLFHWLAASAALFGAVMIQIGTNFANDYYDYRKGGDHSERLGPTRATHAGLVTPRQMKVATFIAFGLAFAAGVYLVYRAGWPVVVIGLTSILFGVLYTGGPYPLGYHGLGEIFVLIFFGPIAVGGTYYVQALHITIPVIVAGLAPGLFSVAILTVNNLRDIKGDTASGKRTLVVRFGEAFAKMEYSFSIGIASLLPVLIVFLVHDRPYAVATIVIPLLAVPTIRTVFANADGPSMNSALAGTGRLLLLYTLVFAVGWLL